MPRLNFSLHTQGIQWVILHRVWHLNGYLKEARKGSSPGCRKIILSAENHFKRKIPCDLFVDIVCLVIGRFAASCIVEIH
jgi:hypothetical protein